MAPDVLIGLHLCGSELRRAEVRRAGERLEVLRLEVLPLTASSPGNGSRPRSPAGTDRVTVMSLPSSDVLSRFWTLPDTDTARLNQMVRHRLEADLPIPAEQLVWGCRRAGPGATEGARDVLVQATRADRISKYLTNPPGGVGVDILTTEAEGVGGLLRHGLRGGASFAGGSLLVLSSPGYWLLAIVQDRLVRCLRRIRVPEGGELGACHEAEQVVGTEVQAHFLQRVLWCGPADSIGAGAMLAERLKVPLEQIEASPALTGPGGAPISPQELATFGLAIGLALTQLDESGDLIRLDARASTARDAQGAAMHWLLAHCFRWTAVAAVLGLLAIGVHVGGMRWESSRMDGILASPESGAAAAAREEKIRAFQRLERYRIDVEDAMAALASVLPDNVLITQVQISRERRMSFKGTAKDPKAVFTFAEALRKTERFTGVNPERSEPAQGNSFTITADLPAIQKLTSVGDRGVKWR